MAARHDDSWQLFIVVVVVVSDKLTLTASINTSGHSPYVYIRMEVDCCCCCCLLLAAQPMKPHNNSTYNSSIQFCLFAKFMLRSVVSEDILSVRVQFEWLPYTYSLALCYCGPYRYDRAIFIASARSVSGIIALSMIILVFLKRLALLS